MKALFYVSILFFLNPLASGAKNCDSSIAAQMKAYAAEMSKLSEYESHGGVSLASVKALGETEVDGLIAYHAVLSVADFGLNLYHVLVNPQSCTALKTTLIWRGDF